jgi:hypothetical protein
MLIFNKKISNENSMHGFTSITRILHIYTVRKWMPIISIMKSMFMNMKKNILARYWSRLHLHDRFNKIIVENSIVRRLLWIFAVRNFAVQLHTESLSKLSTCTYSEQDIFNQTNPILTIKFIVIIVIIIKKMLETKWLIKAK